MHASYFTMALLFNISSSLHSFNFRDGQNDVIFVNGNKKYFVVNRRFFRFRFRRGELHWFRCGDTAWWHWLQI